MEQTDYVIMSAFNVWGSRLDEETLEAVSLTCQPALFGDVVSWTDIVSSANISTSQIESPSLCDAVDECMSGPCIHGSCENKLGGFHCECERGYKGDLCRETQDLCSDGLCKNRASCQTIKGAPVCQCRKGFSGHFCETRKVDGGWSNWSLWSECSSTCGGGTRTRNRECTNPAPQGEGLNCTGKAQQDGTCNEFECPGCLRLRRPLRGYLHCDEMPEMTNCTIQCRHGYAFAERVINSYFCGKDTNYRWNHQTAENRRAILPSCTELTQSHGSTGVVEVGFPNAVCLSAGDKEGLRKAAYKSLHAHSEDIDCLKDESCKVLHIQVENCQLQTNKRRRSVQSAGEVKISIKVYQNSSIVNQSVGLDNFTETETLEPLDTFYFNVTSLLRNDSLTLEVNDQVLHSDPTSITGDAWEMCPPGFLESTVDGFCAPCGIGTYYGLEGNDSDYECHPCPQDTYQDEEGQDECILCPPEAFTDGFHASNVTDCKVVPPPLVTTPPSTHPSHFPLPLIIVVTMGGLLLLVVILIVAAFCKHKQSNKTGSELLTEDIQMFDVATAGSGANNEGFVCNGSDEQGATYHGFIFRSDDVPSFKEKMHDIKSHDTDDPICGDLATEYPTLRAGTNQADDLQVYLPPETPLTFGAKLHVKDKL